jgi:hypothetical protein
MIFRSDESPCKLERFTSHDSALVEYRLALDEYCHIDGLVIKTHCRYKMKKGSPLAWGMTHPTRRFSTTLSYPTEYRASVHWFGFEEEFVDEQEGNPGVYNLRYDSWLLPDSGVSIRILKDGNGKAPRSAA